MILGNQFSSTIYFGSTGTMSFQKSNIPMKNKHKCESCNKLFSRAGNLKTHIYIIHEGHKNHKCESCDKSFSTTGHLKNHIHTIHKGHKDHTCKSCDKSFSMAGNLKKHIRVVHEGHKDLVANHFLELEI